MRKLAVLLLVALPLFADDVSTRQANGGVSVVVPDGWTSVDVDEAWSKRIETEFADSKYERREGDPKALPIIVLQRIPENEDANETDLSESIVIGRMELPPLDIALKDVAEVLATAMSSAFEDVVVESALAEGTIGGEQAYVMKYRYSAIRSDGGRMKVRAALAMVKKGAVLFVPAYSGPADGSYDDYDKVMASLQFVETKQP